MLGHGTGATKGLFAAESAGKTGIMAKVVDNPRNQTLAVAIQWGIIGCLVLYAMWGAHLAHSAAAMQCSRLDRPRRSHAEHREFTAQFAPVRFLLGLALPVCRGDDRRTTATTASAAQSQRRPGSLMIRRSLLQDNQSSIAAHRPFAWSTLD
nr:hypothetical protein [Bradyrhizobium sp. 162]